MPAHHAGMGIISKLFGKTATDRGRVNPRTVGKPGTQRPSPRTIPRGELPDGNRTTIQHPLAQEDVDAFLNGEIQQLLSSNVDKAQYDSERQVLYIWYLGGECWAYDPYTEKEAAMFLQAPSKGGWVNDYIRDRARGVHAHHRNARQVS